MNDRYFFIDESGDSSFYAKRKKLLVGTDGFQHMLNLGMVSIEDKKTIRAAIKSFMESLLADPLYSSIYTLSQPNWYLHACNDHPEVRTKFFEFLRNLDGFKVYIVIGRKRLGTFKNKHNNNEREFYFDLIYHLLKDRLNKEDERYRIFLSAREKSTQKHLSTAIQKAVDRDNRKRKETKAIEYTYDIVRSQDTPELSIIDYLLWALHRYIVKGEDRFYKALVHKYNLIIDLYDIENYSANGGYSNYYHRKRPFSLEQASSFKNDGYV